MSYELRGVSNHQQLDPLFNSLYKLITNETAKIRIVGLPGQSTGERWISHKKGQQCEKRVYFMIKCYMAEVVEAVNDTGQLECLTH